MAYFCTVAYNNQTDATASGDEPDALPYKMNDIIIIIIFLFV